MNKAELESKRLSELHSLAADAGIDKYRMLSRGELVAKLSDGGGGSSGSSGGRGSSGGGSKARLRRRLRAAASAPAPAPRFRRWRRR